MRRPHHLERRRGIALVWFAIMGLMLALMLTFAIDQAHVHSAGRELHNAADAAALAGALHVRVDQGLARLAAQDIGQRNASFKTGVTLDLNEANSVNGDIVLGIFDRDTEVFTPNDTSPNAIQVTTRRDTSHGGELPLFLAWGDKTSVIARRAIAMNAGGTGDGFLVLNPHDECTFEMNGDVDLILNVCTGPGDPDCNDPATCENYGCEQAVENGDAAIQIDSDHECAACFSGSSVHIEAPIMNIVGEDPGFCTNGQPDLDIPEINTDMPYIPDPLAGIPEPAQPSPDLGDIFNETGYFPPGYYSGGILQTANNSDMHLCLGPESFACPPPPGFEPDFTTDEPAVYFLEDDGLSYNGGNLHAYQVMFFVHTGPVDLSGNGVLTIIPADLDLGGQYGGISIFQARDNTTDAKIIGTSNMNLQGTYYFPVAFLELGGTGISVGNQVIAWEVWVHGTGTFTVNYDGRFPAPGNNVFLVY